MDAPDTSRPHAAVVRVARIDESAHRQLEARPCPAPSKNNPSPSTKRPRSSPITRREHRHVGRSGRHRRRHSSHPRRTDLRHRLLDGPDHPARPAASRRCHRRERPRARGADDRGAAARGSAAAADAQPRVHPADRQAQGRPPAAGQETGGQGRSRPSPARATPRPTPTAKARPRTSPWRASAIRDCRARPILTRPATRTRKAPSGCKVVFDGSRRRRQRGRGQFPAVSSNSTSPRATSSTATGKTPRSPTRRSTSRSSTASPNPRGAH